MYLYQGNSCQMEILFIQFVLILFKSSGHFDLSDFMVYQPSSSLENQAPLFLDSREIIFHYPQYWSLGLYEIL